MDPALFCEASLAAVRVSVANDCLENIYVESKRKGGRKGLGAGRKLHCRKLQRVGREIEAPTNVPEVRDHGTQGPFPNQSRGHGLREICSFRLLKVSYRKRRGVKK